MKYKTVTPIRRQAGALKYCFGNIGFLFRFCDTSLYLRVRLGIPNKI